MIKYESFEIEKGHYVKLLKCMNLNDSTSQKSNTNTVIVIIPGNPGIIDFYEHLAVQLNDQTNLPVIGISHTGHLCSHDKNDNRLDWTSLNLVDQINHKLKYIENDLMNDDDLRKLYNNNNNNNNNNSNEEMNLILVGHSIGCYVILQLLNSMRKDVKSKVKKAFLLFPTVERMADTPNGKLLTRLSSFFLWWFAYCLLFIVTLLPSSLHKHLVDLFFTKRHNRYVSKSNDDLVDNASHIVMQMCKSYYCVKSALHMGLDEMHKVKSLNKNHVKDHLDLLVFYYGTADKWCPLDYYYDMKDYVSTLSLQVGDQSTSSIKGSNNAKIPNIILDNHGMEHAFVLFKKQCSIISSMIREWINQISL